MKYSHTVEDSELRRSRRLLGLPPVILEPPLPPLRRKLDQRGSFEATGFQTIEPKQLPEESTANIGSVETSNTDTWLDIIVPIQFYKCLSAPNPFMEPNSITSSGISSIPITVATTGEVSPNLPLSTVQATMALAANTSHSGPTPSIAATTHPYTPSVTGPPFSYGMPSSGTSPALTTSTLQTLGLGAGSSSTRSTWGHSCPFQCFSLRWMSYPSFVPFAWWSASAVRRAACTHKSFWSQESRNTCANSAGRFFTICLEWDVW
jgi:hypothetical protein